MDVRPVEPTDEVALVDFFRSIPEHDRAFFKEDVTQPEVLRRWFFGDPRDIRLASVEDGGSLLAVATVAPGVGRASHVGDLRLVVGADARRRGVGRAVTHRALIHAVEAGMSRITVDVAAGQQGAIEMFRDLGFDPEALLCDRLRDEDGTLHDIVVLAHSVADNWAGMQAAGLGETAT